MHGPPEAFYPSQSRPPRIFSRLFVQSGLPSHYFLVGMDPQIIDPISYLRPPRMSVRSGLSLCRTLLPLVPEVPDPRITKAASALALSADDLEAQWKAKKQPYNVDDVRPYDQRLDRAWAAIENILTQYQVFDAEDADRLLADRLKQRLFPEGLEFLLLPYAEQHAESQRLVDLIEEEDLREELDRLVGENFIDQLLTAHQTYGEVLGIGTAGQPSPSPVSLNAPLRALAQAVTNYALQVLAFGNSDPDNIAAARRALEPIDRLRRAVARRRAGRRNASEEEELDDVEFIEQPEAMTVSEPVHSEIIAN